MTERILKTLFFVFLISSLAVGQSGVIPATSFSMHENNYLYGSPYPVVTFGALRFWDSGTAWHDIETSRGVYNWEPLDTWVNALNSHGVTDLLYTFGHSPSWCGPSDTLPCTNNQDFIDFVSAVATRYKGKIKHFETWNEPYSSGFWTGTMAQLVVLQNDVYNTVKAIDPTAVVHTPVVNASANVDCTNSSASAYSVNAFVTAAGTSHFDVVDFHFYRYPANNTPESIGVQIANAKCGMASLGVGSKPIWNTEFGDGPETPNDNDRSAYLARSFLYLWSQGVARSYWYAYDNQSNGFLFNTTTHVLAPQGMAYQQVYNWMVGSTMTSNCALAGGVWTCGLTLANGNPALAVWKDVFMSTATQSYTPAAQYSQYRDLAGNVTAIASGGPVTIGERPILLESTAAAPLPPTGLTAIVN